MEVEVVNVQRDPKSREMQLCCVPRVLQVGQGSTMERGYGLVIQDPDQNVVRTRMKGEGTQGTNRAHSGMKPPLTFSWI